MFFHGDNGQNKALLIGNISTMQFEERCNGERSYEKLRSSTPFLDNEILVY